MPEQAEASAIDRSRRSWIRLNMWTRFFARQLVSSGHLGSFSMMGQQQPMSYLLMKLTPSFFDSLCADVIGTPSASAGQGSASS